MPETDIPQTVTITISMPRASDAFTGDIAAFEAAVPSLRPEYLRLVWRRHAAETRPTFRSGATASYRAAVLEAHEQPHVLTREGRRVRLVDWWGLFAASEVVHAAAKGAKDVTWCGSGAWHCADITNGAIAAALLLLMHPQAEAWAAGGWNDRGVGRQYWAAAAARISPLAYGDMIASVLGRFLRWVDADDASLGDTLDDIAGDARRAMALIAAAPPLFAKEKLV